MCLRARWINLPNLPESHFCLSFFYGGGKKQRRGATVLCCRRDSLCPESASLNREALGQEQSPHSSVWVAAGRHPSPAQGRRDGLPYLTTCSRICRPKCRTMAVCVFSASFSPQGTQMGHFSLNSSQNWKRAGDTHRQLQHRCGHRAAASGGTEGWGAAPTPEGAGWGAGGGSARPPHRRAGAPPRRLPPPADDSQRLEGRPGPARRPPSAPLARQASASPGAARTGHPRGRSPTPPLLSPARPGTLSASRR